MTPELLKKLGYEPRQLNQYDPPIPFFANINGAIEHRVFFLPNNQFRVELRMGNWSQAATSGCYEEAQRCLNHKARQHFETLRLVMETFTK